jgi:hypothetical protein
MGNRNGYTRQQSGVPYKRTEGRHTPFRLGYPLTAFYRYITCQRLIAGVYLPHPALEKGGFPSLPGGVEYPIELILDIPMQLSAHQPFFRGKHIMILRVAGAGGVKKTDGTLIHKKSIHQRAKKGKRQGNKSKKRENHIFSRISTIF